MSESTESFGELADLCQHTYHPVRPVQALKVDSPPHIQSALGTDKSDIHALGSTHTHHVVARDVIYHLDLFSQYLDLSQVWVGMPPPPPAPLVGQSSAVNVAPLAVVHTGKLAGEAPWIVFVEWQ